MKTHLFPLFLLLAVALASAANLDSVNQSRSSSLSSSSSPNSQTRAEKSSKIKKSKRSDIKPEDSSNSNSNTTKCQPSEFACDGKCLNPKLLCDKNFDCKDKSDEDHCQLLEECVGADWFKCANHKCISVKWLCDGINDCSLFGDGDISDEMGCENATSSTQKKSSVVDECQDRETSFQCHSGHCLPKSFYCDGDVDCSDGSDEVPGCVKIKPICQENQFQCTSEECLDPKLRCDGKVDCLDGFSDEDKCIKPKECHRDQGKFLCKSGDSCIEGHQVCDKKSDCPDKSDEFPDCEKSCLNSNCSQGCIPDPDVKAPGSGSCYCLKGYAPSTRDKGNCVDIDECTVFGTCSQICTDLLGSFECSCINGFRLSNDNSSCELIEDDASLIFALHSGVRVLKMGQKRERYYSLVEKLGSPVSITFDARQDWVYWTDAMEHEEAIWRSRLNGSGLEVVISTGLILPEGIAFDWIANNIYFTDSNRSHIVVCTADGGNCSVLIQEQMDKPRDLAVHPNLGLIFWTDWGVNPTIIRAGMDGSLPIPIVGDNLKWPNGITVDHGNGRIYWTDANTDKIETANLDGQDRRVVKSSGIKHPFGVDVLGDMVFWSDWNLYEIQKSNKFDGSKHMTLVKEPYEQMNGLALFHKANQPLTRRNHCADAGCSHICTLTPNKSYHCMCPVGMNIDRRNKKTCTPNKSWPYIVVSYNNTVKVAPMDAIGGNVFKEYVIPELVEIGAIATVPFNNTAFISDLEKQKIYSLDLLTSKLTVVVNEDVVFVKGMDYDEIGKNLYWVDSTKKTVEVMSLRTRTRVILFKEIDRPMDLVLAPDLRMLFLIEIGNRGGKIVRMNMNGFNRRVLHRTPEAEPMALTYNKDMQRLYWTDAVSDTIGSIGVDGSSPYIAVARAGAAFGIAAFGKRIFWSDRHMQMLKGRQLDTFLEERGMFIGNYSSIRNGYIGSLSYGNLLAKVDILNKEPGYGQSLLDNHECAPSKKQCSHVCLLSVEEFQGTCICPDILQLDQDGRTCVPLKAGDAPTLVVCAGGRCRTQTTSKKPKTGSSKGDGKFVPDKIDARGKDDIPEDLSSSSTMSTIGTPDYTIDEGFSWTEDDDDKKGKSKSKSKRPSSERASRREQLLLLQYDDYDGGLPSNTAILPNGELVMLNGEPVTQLESTLDKNVVSEGTHPMAIVVGVFILLILVGIIVGIVLHRRNVHPKVLVRPYVQHWVKYVNQPVQRFFEHRGEQLDGKKNIYDEVYRSGAASEHTYTNVGYENMDPVTDLQDSSVNMYEEPGDTHRISYDQKDKLLP